MKLTKAQRDTLDVLGDGRWYEIAACDPIFSCCFRSLLSNGLLERRGPEVRITPAGRQALKEGE